MAAPMTQTGVTVDLGGDVGDSGMNRAREVLAREFSDYVGRRFEIQLGYSQAAIWMLRVSPASTRDEPAEPELLCAYVAARARWALAVAGFRTES